MKSQAYPYLKSIALKKMVALCLSILVLIAFQFDQVFGQGNRVGINTATPLAVLHVADSSVLFSGSTTLSPNPGQVPVSGAGHRLMWYADKAAFLAGGLNPSASSNWDRDSIGQYAIALGRDVKAKGNNAVAIGGSTAIGNSSIAIGSGGALALGSQSTVFGYANAYGNQSTAFHTAFTYGIHSLAAGFISQAYAPYSMAIGYTAKSFGDRSVALGSYCMTNSYGSLVVGTSNDTVNASRTSWVAGDPLFVVGNGSTDFNKSNALVLLKNGNMGLGINQPTFRLHLRSTTGGNGTYTNGLLVQNTNNTPGEAAVSFRNTAIPSTRQWIIGMDENPKLIINYGESMSGANTKVVIDTFGQVGIRTLSPQARLHLVHNNPSGGTYSPSSLSIFESNVSSFIQLSHENTDETGILSGNQATIIRSAIVFAADSSIDLRAGGNGTDVKISTEGNVGIGIYTPTAKLHVNGTTKLGVNGTTITEIIRATVNANVPSVPANGGTIAQLFTVTNAALTSTVSVSQSGALGSGLVIASARVSAANTVEVRIVNTTAAAVDPPAMDYHFTVIR